jgi:hypothetical protein
MGEEQIDQMLGTNSAPEDDEPEEENVFLVWPENWDCVRVFLSLGSRWMADGMSGYFYGMERADIWSTMQMLQIEPPRYSQVLEDFLVMEAEVLKVFNKKH